MDAFGRHRLTIRCRGNGGPHRHDAYSAHRFRESLHQGPLLFARSCYTTALYRSPWTRTSPAAFRMDLSLSVILPARWRGDRVRLCPTSRDGRTANGTCASAAGPSTPRRACTVTRRRRGSRAHRLWGARRSGYVKCSVRSPSRCARLQVSYSLGTRGFESTTSYSRTSSSLVICCQP